MCLCLWLDLWACLRCAQEAMWCWQGICRHGACSTWHSGRYIRTSKLIILYCVRMCYVVSYDCLTSTNILWLFLCCLLHFYRLWCTSLYCIVLYCIVLYCNVLGCHSTCSQYWINIQLIPQQKQLFSLVYINRPRTLSLVTSWAGIICLVRRWPRWAWAPI